MKILVTGGSGFIGSHLVNNLVERGAEVIVLDNLTSGDKKNVDKDVTFIEGNIRDEDDVKKAIRDCDVVFHLAALTNVRGTNEREIYKTNFLGSRNVFNIAKENGCKIIFTSSAAVYGNSSPSKEEDECKPISEYGMSKLRAEKLLSDAFVVRLFNVYGPGGHGVVNIFCEKILQKATMPVYGGHQTRDFVHVADVVDALLLGIDNKGIYNVASGSDTTIMGLITMIKNISGAELKLKHEPENKLDIKHSVADIKKIKKLGWEPKIDLFDGIKDILQSFGKTYY